jgi:hypothetical protein
MLKYFKRFHWLSVIGVIFGVFLISGCGGDDGSLSKTSPDSSTLPKLNLNLPVTIPIVFHVIIDPEIPESNVSDEVIKTQMQVLNQIFSQNNEEIAFLGDLKSLTEDTQIRFDLAKFDPDGKPSSGINRLPDAKPGSNDAPAWPHEKYLNVWIDNLASHNAKVHVLGSTTIHCDNTKTLSTYIDGIEIHYESLLINDAYHARTLPHEIGHWLGLSHAFGTADTCNPSADLNITEAGGLETGTMDNTKRFCSNNNVMQESKTDHALNIFTKGQSYLMKKAFAPGNCRSALYQNLSNNS